MKSARGVTDKRPVANVGTMHQKRGDEERAEPVARANSGQRYALALLAHLKRSAKDYVAMKPRFSENRHSGRVVQWPLLGILTGCALGIALRNWAFGLAIALLGGVGFLQVNFQLEGRKEKLLLAAAYALVLLGAVLAARGRPELVYFIFFAVALSDIFRRGRQ